MELEPGLLVQTLPADRCLSPTASEAAIAGLLLTLDIDAAVQPSLQKLKEALRPYKTRNAFECASRGAAAQHLSSDMKKNGRGIVVCCCSVDPPADNRRSRRLHEASFYCSPPTWSPPPVGAVPHWSRCGLVGTPFDHWWTVPECSTSSFWCRWWCATLGYRDGGPARAGQPRSAHEAAAGVWEIALWQHLLLPSLGRPAR